METAADNDSKPVSDRRTVEECQSMIQRSLRTPMVKFLKEHLEKAGCGIPTNFIRAVDCKRKMGGGYVSGEGECVRRRVMKSVMANPYCLEAAAKDAMEAVIMIQNPSIVLLE